MEWALCRWLCALVGVATEPSCSGLDVTACSVILALRVSFLVVGLVCIAHVCRTSAAPAAQNERRVPTPPIRKALLRRRRES